MTEFNELDLTKSVDSLDEEEAKKTLSDFMESHKNNQTAYDELQTELEETETEYKEKIEERDEKLATFKQRRAEEAANHVKMPADILVDRFSFSELEQIIEEAEDADFSEDEEEEEEENLTTFSERPEKGETETQNNAEYRDRAKSVLGGKNFPVGE